MLKTPRGLTLLSVALLATLLFVAALAFIAGQRPRIVPLRGGGTIELVDVTYGTNHSVAYGTWWQRLLDPVVPQAWKSRFGSYRMNHVSTRPGTLCFWTVHRRPPNQGLNGFAAVFDEHGCEYRGFALRTYAPLSGTTTLDLWEFPTFPRRGQRVGLRLYGQFGKGPLEPVAELTINNPASKRYPAWEPKPLPSRVQRGDLVCTLTSLTHTKQMPGRTWPPPPVQRAGFTRAAFRLERDGKPATGWQVRLAEVADATGNVFTARSRYHLIGGEHVLLLTSPLWPDEQAWKLKAEVVRSQQAVFSPDELLTFRSLPVPGAAATKDVYYQAIRGNVTLQLEQIRRGTFGPSWVRAPREHVELRGKCAGLPNGAQLVPVQATDQDGRRLRLVSWPSRGTDVRYLVSPLPDGVKRINLTVGIDVPRTFEFLARPTFDESEPRGAALAQTNRGSPSTPGSGG